MSDEEWRERALCRQVDGDMFFPEKGEQGRNAKRVCQLCEVRAECLEYAVENFQAYGIWGGLTEVERRPLRAARGRTGTEAAA